MTVSVQVAAPIAEGRRRNALAKLSPWLWYTPSLVMLALITVYPALLVFWLSFQRTRYYDILGFAGLENYVDLLSSSEFYQITVNSIVFVFGSLALVLPLGLMIAISLQAMGPAAKLFRTVLLLPWTLSQAVIATFWVWLLQPSYGPIAWAIREFGLEPGLMLTDFYLAMPIVIGITVWWSFPYVMVLVSAALQSVPVELYEAVEIDGGGSVAKFRFVIFPHVLPTLANAGLALGILYMAMITLILVLTNGGPIGATTTWSLEIFQSSFESVDMGPASVLSIVVLIIKLFLGYLYVRLTGRSTG